MRVAIAAACVLIMASAAPAADRRPSPTGEQELARLLAGRQPGKPVDCITQSDMDRVQVVDGTAIVYGSGSRLFVNRPPNGAGALRSDDVLVTSVTGGQLCRIDTVRLLDRNSRMVRGFVVLGSFVPYSRTR